MNEENTLVILVWMSWETNKMIKVETTYFGNYRQKIILDNKNAGNAVLKLGAEK